MEKNKYFLSCDIGSEYIKLILFEYDNSAKGFKPVKHIIRKVIESDLNNRHPERCIEETFKEAANDLQTDIKDNIFVNINNQNIISQTVLNKIDFDRPFVINENTLKDLNEIVFNSVDKHEEIIYLRTNKYIIDKKTTVSNPLLIEAKTLEVENFLVKTDTRYLDDIENILESASLSATSIIPGVIAQGEILLSTAEKNLGAALLDIGYSTTDVVIYEGGNINLAFTLNIGIGDFIESISQILHLKYKDAYYIYKEYANLSEKNSETPISFIDIYGAKKVVLVGFLNKIIEDLLGQLLIKVRSIFTNKNIKCNAITLSGGISNLVGIRGLVSNIFSISKVKIGKLNECKSVELSDNKWATCFGMMHIATDEIKPKPTDIYNIFYKIKTFIENLLK